MDCSPSSCGIVWGEPAPFLELEEELWTEWPLGALLAVTLYNLEGLPAFSSLSPTSSAYPQPPGSLETPPAWVPSSSPGTQGGPFTQRLQKRTPSSLLASDREPGGDLS